MSKFILLVVVAGGLIWAFSDRRMLMMRLGAITEGGQAAELIAPGDEGPAARWYDDYFTVHVIGEDTYAIGEPRYHFQNYSYLIAGRERALLFDGGPGVRNIRSVAESLTDLPITFMPSHLHYDHVANNVGFERIALLNVQPIRDRATGNSFSPSDRQHLGMMEGYTSPVWKITEWVEPDSEYDLGGRSLHVYYTPGHTSDSVSLYDRENGIFFSGDYLYPGELWAFTPTSSMSDYLATAEPLLGALPPDTLFLGAHREAPPGVPTTNYADLRSLRQALQRIKAGNLEGEGRWPVTYPVNDNVRIVAEPRWLQDW